MESRTFVTDGERWRVEAGSAVGVSVGVRGSYVSETAESYRIVFVQPFTKKRRQVDWHKPLSKCTVEDLQLIFEASEPV